MKAYEFIFNGMAIFEVSLVNYFIKSEKEVVTVALDSNIIKTEEGFNIKPDITFDDLDFNDIGIFIIPGGECAELFKNDALKKVLVALDNKKTLIASICSGTMHLAYAGLLNNRKYVSAFNMEEVATLENAVKVDSNVLKCENIITAKPNGYVDFAIEVGKALNIFEDDADLQETINYFKYFNDENQK